MAKMTGRANELANVHRSRSFVCRNVYIYESDAYTVEHEFFNKKNRVLLKVTSSMQTQSKSLMVNEHIGLLERGKLYGENA